MSGAQQAAHEINPHSWFRRKATDEMKEKGSDAENF